MMDKTPGKKLIENHILPCRIEGSFEKLKADLVAIGMDSFNSCTSVMFLCGNVNDRETSRQNAVYGNRLFMMYRPKLLECTQKSFSYQQGALLNLLKLSFLMLLVSTFYY